MVSTVLTEFEIILQSFFHAWPTMQCQPRPQGLLAFQNGGAAILKSEKTLGTRLLQCHTYFSSLTTPAPAPHQLAVRASNFRSHKVRGDLLKWTFCLNHI